jgi:Protein of unknown function (DUF1350)
MKDPSSSITVLAYTVKDIKKTNPSLLRDPRQRQQYKLTTHHTPLTTPSNFQSTTTIITTEHYYYQTTTRRMAITTHSPLSQSQQLLGQGKSRSRKTMFWIMLMMMTTAANFVIHFSSRTTTTTAFSLQLSTTTVHNSRNKHCYNNNVDHFLKKPSMVVVSSIGRNPFLHQQHQRRHHGRNTVQYYSYKYDNDDDNIDYDDNYDSVDVYDDEDNNKNNKISKNNKDEDDTDEDDYYNDNNYYKNTNTLNDDIATNDNDAVSSTAIEDEVDPTRTTTTTTTGRTTNNNRGGYYQVSFNNDVDPSETQLDWETCYGEEEDGKKIQALVLLPPAAIERPRAILHFVGGTFFGSTPRVWYRKLLEGIVRNTQTACIVTPIPVTVFQSPLQHIQLSKRIQSALQYAWSNVLEDEYGPDNLKGVPLCGIGHSLGSRLLTVLTTANQNKNHNNNNNNQQQRRRRQQTYNDSDSGSIPPYKALVLISFTNYGASAGIPGIGTLLKQSRKQERTIKVNNERQRYQNARKARNVWWLDDNDNNDYNDDDDDDDYDDYDDDYNKKEDTDADWAEIMNELQSVLQQQASRVKKALTPPSKDLEFFPTPDQLWKAIREDGRYSVKDTLLVQFDNDPIDQSSQLAQLLYNTNSSTVKFARLRGTHLTPIMTTLLLEEEEEEEEEEEKGVVEDYYDDDNDDDNDDDEEEKTRVSDYIMSQDDRRRKGKPRRSRRRNSSMNSSSMNSSSNGKKGLLGSNTGSVWKKIILGKSKTKEQEIMAMQELRQSIVSYINDIIIIGATTGTTGTTGGGVAKP